jgi:uncharacterized protein
MERAFADTGYWIALLNPRDDLHEKASAVSRDYGPNQIVTSEMVLIEFLNSFSDYGPRLRQAAARAARLLRDTIQIVIVPQTRELFERALKRYEDMADKSWSLTDCASFLIMEDEQLTAALTHDRHFAQAGFQTLLR